MKSNIHKKMYKEDKWGRLYYSKHASTTIRKNDKHLGKKAWRNSAKQEIKESTENIF